MKLVRAHALLGSAKQMDRKPPLIERDMRIGKDRANGDGELLTAPATLPHTLADWLLGTFLRFQAIGVIEFATMRANRAFRPTLRFKELAGLLRVAEVGGDIGK